MWARERPPSGRDLRLWGAGHRPPRRTRVPSFFVPRQDVSSGGSDLSGAVWPYAAFNLLVIALLAVDLGLLNRKAHVIRVREAGLWAGLTVVLAMAFAVLMWLGMLPIQGVGGQEDALAFLTGYIIELALSVDNIFVFVLI